MDAPKPGKRNGMMMISAMSAPGNIPASDQNQNLPENHLSLKMLSLVYGAINNSSEVISVKKDKDNNIIEGSPDKIKFVTDIWKFTKNIKNNSPNWYLAEIISQ